MTKSLLRKTALISLLIITLLLFSIPFTISRLSIAEDSLTELKSTDLFTKDQLNSLRFGYDASYLVKGEAIRLFSATIYSGSKRLGEIGTRAEQKPGAEDPEIRLIHFYPKEGGCQVIKNDEVAPCSEKKIKRRKRKGTTLSLW